MSRVRLSQEIVEVIVTFPTLTAISGLFGGAVSQKVIEAIVVSTDAGDDARVSQECIEVVFVEIQTDGSEGGVVATGGGTQSFGYAV